MFEIIEEIAELYHIKSLRDFGLFVEYQESPRLIDRDEKLWDILNNEEMNFEVNEESPQKNAK